MNLLDRVRIMFYLYSIYLYSYLSVPVVTDLKRETEANIMAFHCFSSCSKNCLDLGFAHI